MIINHAELCLCQHSHLFRSPVAPAQQLFQEATKAGSAWDTIQDSRQGCCSSSFLPQRLLVSAHNTQQNIFLGYSDTVLVPFQIVGCYLLWFLFYFMIVAACSARHSGALTPFFSAFGAMSGDGTSANEHHVQCEAQVWGESLGFGKPWHSLLCLDRPSGLDTPTSICNDFSWFTMLKLKTTWL